LSHLLNTSPQVSLTVCNYTMKWSSFRNRVLCGGKATIDVYKSLKLLDIKIPCSFVNLWQKDLITSDVMLRRVYKMMMWWSVNLLSGGCHFWKCCKLVSLWVRVELNLVKWVNEVHFIAFFTYVNEKGYEYDYIKVVDEFYW